MLMSEENYKKLTDWYNFVIETANDEVAEYYIGCLLMATYAAKQEAAKEKRKAIKARKIKNKIKA